MTKEQIFLETLKEALKDPTKRPAVIQATVKSVESTTCTVVLSTNDLEVDEVLLNATEANEDGFVLVPEDGTNVLIGLIGGDENRLYLAAIDKVKTVKFIVSGNELFSIDKTAFKADLKTGKFELKNNVTSVKSLLEDIVSMVKTLTVPTPSGVSGTPLPPTILQATTIETKIGQLFN